MLTPNTVISQGKCPHCSSSDAYTIYSDGSTYCFSCSTYGKSTYRRSHTTPTPKSPITGKQPVTLENCPENYNWLKQFLTDAEITANFFYCPYSQRHVYEHGEYSEARSVNKHRVPKVLSSGNKPLLLLGNGSQVAVIVEDIVSALVISRQYKAMPLFGNSFATSHGVYLLQCGMKSCIIWLDKDKYLEGQRYAKTLSALLPTKAIFTDKDPKYLTNQEVKTKIDEIITRTP